MTIHKTLMSFFLLFNVSYLLSMQSGKVTSKPTEILVSDCVKLIYYMTNQQFKKVENNPDGLQYCSIEDSSDKKEAEAYCIIHNMTYKAPMTQDEFHLESILNISKEHVGFNFYVKSCAPTNKHLQETYPYIIKSMQRGWRYTTKEERKYVAKEHVEGKKYIFIKDNAFKDEYVLINYLISMINASYAHASILFGNLKNGPYDLKPQHKKINLVIQQKNFAKIASALGLMLDFSCQ